MSRLESLGVISLEIENLYGLENAINLKQLYLSWSNISDITPLKHLKNLTTVYLYYNYLGISEGSKTMDIINQLIFNGCYVIYEPQWQGSGYWFLDNDKWYFIESNREKATGWLKYGGKWYYLYSDRSMAANTIIGGYRLGKDGAWIQ